MPMAALVRPAFVVACAGIVTSNGVGMSGEDGVLYAPPLGEQRRVTVSVFRVPHAPTVIKDTTAFGACACQDVTSPT